MRTVCSVRVGDHPVEATIIYILMLHLNLQGSCRMCIAVNWIFQFSKLTSRHISDHSFENSFFSFAVHFIGLPNTFVHASTIHTSKYR